jgi:D-sedoheptulose 7-phosphate isomerase
MPLGWNVAISNSVFVFIVGGDSKERNVSVNLIHALDYTKKVGARILGVIGRDVATPER